MIRLPIYCESASPVVGLETPAEARPTWSILQSESINFGNQLRALRFTLGLTNTDTGMQDITLFKFKEKADPKGSLLVPSMTPKDLEVNDGDGVYVSYTGPPIVEIVTTPPTPPATLNNHTPGSRLSSFENNKWPGFPGVESKVKPKLLAEAGFYYDPAPGKLHQTRCVACQGVVVDWDPFDDVWEEHAKLSMSCPFVKSFLSAASESHPVTPQPAPSLPILKPASKSIDFDVSGSPSPSSPVFSPWVFG